MALPDALRQIVTSSGYVTETQFDQAVKSAEDLGKSLVDILLFRGLITEEALGKLLAEYYQVPYVSLKNISITPDILATIPEKTATAFKMVPFALKDGVLMVAMENPHDIEAIEFAKRSSGSQVSPYYTTPADIDKALGQYKANLKGEFTQIIDSTLAETKASAQRDLPVAKILDTMLEYATAEGASDIHIEALEDRVLVRFRVDGILRDVVELPKDIHSALVARIKILSELKLDEHRVPQDGRFKFQLKDVFIALRVSVLPAFFGENIVLRVLAESARPLSLEELGITGKFLDLIKHNIKKPHGLILVTGPTGSGKTTTLYSLLNILNTPDINICTIEDPIEYGIRRVNQVQVNTATGLTFAAGLRSLLRHDPNVIMIGEIRDADTAEIAIHAALTGHLVVSTLHTNSAAAAVPRLIDMGVEPFLIASTLNLVVAQRLVRRINPRCVTKFVPEPDILATLEQAVGEPITIEHFYKPSDQGECEKHGYKGRVGVYEILEINQEIRTLISKRATTQELEQAAIKNGMTKLLEDGINKAAAGITTLEEALRVMRE